MPVINSTIIPVPDSRELMPGYRVLDDGRVQSCMIRGSMEKDSQQRIGTKWHNLKPTVRDDGYSVVHFGGVNGKTQTVHRIVLEAFVGPRPPGMQCRHIDGNRSNNRLDNLCWGTPRENHDDTIRHGRMSRGTNHKWSKLTDEQIVMIINKVNNGYSYAEISRQFGISRRTVPYIINGRTRRNTSKQFIYIENNTNKIIVDFSRKLHITHEEVINRAIAMFKIATDASGETEPCIAIARHAGKTIGDAVRSLE